MDDTQQSRVSDATATRKRRSSILKSQRPARTPFSELEFNVATPTDTAKSRRVSFSRRTGVAEFITNEATTTWKNFYEEHNKSLESSGNDSDVNASKQPVEHLGKRIFDQQFEEVEAVDFIGSLNPSISSNSLNNINFTEQIATLENTADGNLPIPQNKLELSILTDQQSKLFGNDFTVTGLGELSGRINVNFSAMQQMGEKDDLDEIERDLERVSNVVCQGPNDRHNLSEYIEVDLNITHVAKNEDCDMSITDTIHSPKVQEVSKSCSIDKKNSFSKDNQDWTVDKENIVVNPYAAPREADNFAVNDEPNQVLVFDGKRLTLQTEKPDKDYRKTLLPHPSLETPQRKTIVLNTNDDLPNFADDMSSKSEIDIRRTLYSDLDLSMTLPVNRVDIIPKRKTIIDNTGNISITQALPSNIISGPDAQRTSDENDVSCNISMTQALPAMIYTESVEPSERRRTVLFENDTGNISVTQALPTNIIQSDIAEQNDKRKTIVFEEDNNISITQAISNHIILEQKDTEKRKTIVFDDNNCDISITQALPDNIVIESQSQEKLHTIIYEDEIADISMTQAVPSNCILLRDPNVLTEKRIVHEDESGNISITQSLPPNIILGNTESLDKTQMFDAVNVSMTQVLPTNILEPEDHEDVDTNNSRTVVFEKETCNISITQVVPSDLLPDLDSLSNAVIPKKTSNSSTCSSNEIIRKGITILYDKDEAEISVTQPIPSNVIITDENTIKEKPIVIDDEKCDISLAPKLPASVFLLSGIESSSDANVVKDVEEATEQPISNVNLEVQNRDIIEDLQERRKTIVFTDGEIDAEMSITEAIPKVQNIIQEVHKQNTLKESITKPIPADLIAIQSEILNKYENKRLDLEQARVSNQNQNVIVYQAVTTSSIANKEQEILNIEAPTDDNVSTITTSSKADDTDVTESISSKDRTDDQSLILRENISSITKTVYVAEEYPTSGAPGNDQKMDALEDMDVDQIENVSISPVDNVSISKEEYGDRDSVQSLGKNQRIAEPTASALDVLLDMSSEGEFINKNMMVENETWPIEPVVKYDSCDSTDTVTNQPFTIKGDVESQVQTDGINNDKFDTGSVTETIDSKPLPIEYKEPEILDVFEKKLEELSTEIKKRRNSPPRRSSPERENAVVKYEDKSLRKSIKDVNDTKELLELISDFTDKTRCDVGVDPAPRGSVRNRPVTDSRTSTQEPKRLSFAPNRQSFIFNRENLLSNISMAQAALQQSRIELDESSLTEDNQETPTEESSGILKKSVRLSSEVVKTLHFDDESQSESSMKSDLDKFSPLKKTAFGESSYMKEPKANVIPSYLKDVSEGIKELMADLVKPMADDLPFDSHHDRRVRKSISTASTQIQANLVTSSQIDLDTEQNFNAQPVYDANTSKSSTQSQRRSVSIESPHVIKEMTPNSSLKSVELSVPSFKAMEVRSRPCMENSPGQVLVFDHMNPLNNILLGPLDYAQTHKYNPIGTPKSDETLCGSDHSASVSCQINCEFNKRDTDDQSTDYHSDRVTTQYHIETTLSRAMQGDISISGPDTQSVRSDVTKSSKSKDEAHLTELKDIEVNTLIVMKTNKELLEASSSLTLVDEPINQCGTDTGIKSSSLIDTDSKSGQLSPVRVIFHVEERDTTSEVGLTDKLESEITLDDEDIMDQICKASKRGYNPSTPDRSIITSLEITPKPISKIPKLSRSPTVNTDYEYDKSATKLSPERDVDSHPNRMVVDHVESKTKPKKKSPRKSKEKSGGALTVQQLITEYHVKAGLNRTIHGKPIIDAIHSGLHCKSDTSTAPLSQSDIMEANSLDVMSSFTSSKNLRAMKEVNSVSTTLSSLRSQSTVQSVPSSRIDWHPELCSLASARSLKECDSGVNIVAKIDMLPFMGSHECEWESSSIDTWCFRLLHGRLRLTIRLAHRHDNATRTRVRADTPVTDVSVETVQHVTEKKNPVATLCVSYACETMRYMVSRMARAGSACHARDVPPLLRRCAAVARLALRWGRAMHDAKLHLAYTLDNDGHLTLKVANIPLRSVWEVSMDLELVVEDAREPPWPRAANVRVTRVVSDVPVSDDDVQRAIANTPKDWGHVPRTLWRIFRYLKHKTRDDDLLLG